MAGGIEGFGRRWRRPAHDVFGLCGRDETHQYWCQREENSRQKSHLCMSGEIGLGLNSMICQAEKATGRQATTWLFCIMLPVCYKPRKPGTRTA